MAEAILHDQFKAHTFKSLKNVIIKVVDDPDVNGAINVSVEFSPDIDNHSPSHQFAHKVIGLLQDKRAYL